MNYTGPILPHRTPKSLANQTALAQLQDQILQGLLFMMLITGIFGLLAIVPGVIQARTWGMLVLSAILLMATLALIVLRNLPFQARAGLFLAILYMLDAQLLISTGLSAMTIVLFFALVYFAAMFFGWELAAGVLALWLAASMTALLTPGHLGDVMGVAALSNVGLLGRLASILAMVLASGSTIVTHLLLSNQFRQSLQKERQISVELEKERASVTQRLEEKTRSLQRRLLQGRVAAEISERITGMLDPDLLLQNVVDLIGERFALYYIGAFILDTQKRFAVLKAGTGDAGKKMMAEGHRLPVGSSSMIGWTILNGHARIALDAGSEAVRFNNPHLPFTRSELALPILARGEVTGALSIQSIEPSAFDEDDIAILQGIANILGTALENARIYRRAEENLEEVRLVSRDYLDKVWGDLSRQRGGLEYTFENPAVSFVDEEVTPHEFPILLRDQVIGAITLDSDRPELTSEELSIVETITAQTAMALENARLLEESQRHTLEEQKLNEMARQFTEAGSIEEILRSAVQELGNLPSVAEVSIHLVPPQSGLTVDPIPDSHHGHHDNGNGRGKQEER